MRRAERLDGIGSLIGQGGTRYRRLLKILIESGGMYCLTWLILLCLVVTRSMATHIFLTIIGQLTVSQLPTPLLYKEPADSGRLSSYSPGRDRGYIRR